MTEQHSWKQEEDKEGIAMKFENKVAIITLQKKEQKS